MSAGVEPARGQLLMVGFGLWAEGVKSQQQLALARGVAVGEEFFDVLGIFEVAVALVAAGVGGDELVVGIDAEPIGKAFEQQAGRGVGAGHGVAIGLANDAKAVGGAHGPSHAGVGWEGGQREQMGLFRGKE